MTPEEKKTLRDHNKQLLDESRESTSKENLGIVALNHHGEVEHHFPNRMVASKYILNHMKGYQNPERKKIMQVYGNIYSGLKKTWRVYGFYWKLSSHGGLVTSDPIYVVNEKTYKYVVYYSLGQVDDRVFSHFPDLDVGVLTYQKSEIISDLDFNVVACNGETFEAKNELLGLSMADSIDELFDGL